MWARTVLITTATLVSGCPKSSGTTSPDDSELASSSDPAPDGGPTTAPDEATPVDEPAYDVAHAIEIQGPLTEAQVEAVAEDHHGPISACFEDALRRMSSTDLNGEILVTFEVGADGKVVGEPTAKPSRFHDPIAARCLVDDVRTWALPKPPKGKTVKVIYPFAMRSY